MTLGCAEWAIAQFEQMLPSVVLVKISQRRNSISHVQALRG
jgi:hypothetical protein